MFPLYFDFERIARSQLDETLAPWVQNVVRSLTKWEAQLFVRAATNSLREKNFIHTYYVNQFLGALLEELQVRVQPSQAGVASPAPLTQLSVDAEGVVDVAWNEPCATLVAQARQQLREQVAELLNGQLEQLANVVQVHVLQAASFYRQTSEEIRMRLAGAIVTCNLQHEGVCGRMGDWIAAAQQELTLLQEEYQQGLAHTTQDACAASYEEEQLEAVDITLVTYEALRAKLQALVKEWDKHASLHGVDTVEMLALVVQELVARQITTLIPWRKGPFRLLGIDIDAEWRCNLKWERVRKLPHTAWQGTGHIMDVGSGNGYYLWRMWDEQPQAQAWAVEPYEHFINQYHLVHSLARVAQASHSLPLLLPCTLDDYDRHQFFDLLFNMGVLYHRKDPVAFLRQLQDHITPQGQLLLETIILPDDAPETELLIPHKGKYAGMGNVYSIPRYDTLVSWLEACGYHSLQRIDTTPTTPLEQRATPLSAPVSLIDHLDSTDSTRTVEGYPAPVRVMVLASVPTRTI